MATYYSLGALGGAADMVLEDRFFGTSDNFALDPADLTRPTASSPKTTGPATCPGLPPSCTYPEPYSSHVKLNNVSHDTSQFGSASDALLPFLDPALGGNVSAMLAEQKLKAGKKPSSRATTTSNLSRSSQGSVCEGLSKSTTPLTAPSPEEPADSLPPPKKRTRKAKPKAVVVKVEPGEEDKRDQFLERNRVAASKCRKKKKAWMTDLEEVKQTATRQHEQLRSEYNSLVNEVGELKNMIMSHASCNNSNIDRWIENEAQRFVESTNRRLERDGWRQATRQLQGPNSQSHTLSATSPAGSNQNFADAISIVSDEEVAAMMDMSSDLAPWKTSEFDA